MKVERKGWAKVRLKQSIEVEDEMERVSTYLQLLCYQVICGYMKS